MRASPRFSVVACAGPWLVLIASCSTQAALDRTTDSGTDKPEDSGPATDASPGTVTLRLVIPTDRSFCDQGTVCEGQRHISVLTAAGASVGTEIPWCATICSSACKPPPCPGIACIPQGLTVKTFEIQWDGSSFKGSTCGNNTTCYQPTVAPPGHYVARMCATPGTIATPDGGGGPSTCTATGPVACVDVPFDLPGSNGTVVQGTLP